MDLCNLTLNQWNLYLDFIQPYEDAIKEYSSLKDCQRKKILLVNAIVERACLTYDYFQGNMIDVDSMIEYYNNIEKLFTKNYESSIVVPDDRLDVYTPITFGQFVDSKDICDKFTGNKWGLFKYLIAIYCNGVYKDDYCNEKSEQFTAAGQFKISDVIVFYKWWERFNTNISNSFAVFTKTVSSGKDANVSGHMKRWGWIHFLKEIAKTKVFDIPGGNKDSIECVRAKNLFDILVWASEEKEYNEAVYNDLNEQ